MRMLIIGDADGVWIKKSLQNTINPLENDIFILSYENEKDKNWYESMGIQVMQIPNYRVWKLKPLLAGYLLKKKLSSVAFDVLIIHYVNRHHLLIAQQLMPFTRRKIAFFWGSDIFRADSKTIQFNKRYLENYDCINLTTDAMAEQFHEQYGAVYDDKITRASFGLDTLDALRKHLETPISSNYFPEISRDKVVVAIGYNGNSSQQHCEVLKEIGKLGKAHLSKLHLILKMTYGGTEKYTKSVREMLDKIPCTYTLLTEYLSDDDCAALTCLTDILIHAQTTDALSAAILEHIFVGALVLNPTWICYRELEDENSCDVKYRTFEEMREILETNLTKKELIFSQQETKLHRQIIERIASWENNKQKWEQLYYGE